LGLGLCYFKLKNFGQAKKAFQVVDKMEQHQNVSALIYLAILELNDQKHGNVEEALRNIKMAYELEPLNPLVCCYLAAHCFYRKEFDMVCISLQYTTPLSYSTLIPLSGPSLSS
jgi:tetratricopeptide (TPR) repeat protein